MSGMTLSVDDGLIRPVVQAEIQAAIVREFEKTPDIISKIVKEILIAKVDNDGKYSSYSNAMTYVEWLCRQAIREATKEALKEFVENNKGSLFAEVEKQLQANKKDIAAGLITGLLKAVETSWRFSVSIDLPKD